MCVCEFLNLSLIIVSNNNIIELSLYSQCVLHCTPIALSITGVCVCALALGML